MLSAIATLANVPSSRIRWRYRGLSHRWKWTPAVPGYANIVCKLGIRYGVALTSTSGANRHQSFPIGKLKNLRGTGLLWWYSPRCSHVTPYRNGLVYDAHFRQPLRLNQWLQRRYNRIYTNYVKEPYTWFVATEPKGKPGCVPTIHCTRAERQEATRLRRGSK